MNKPIIQLFKTINQYYLLDGIKCEVFPISKESFWYLNEVMNGKHEFAQENLPNDELRQLYLNGYLAAESNVEKIQHAYTNYLPYFMERKLNKITLQVTQNCNFRCKYCIYSEETNKKQRTHSQESMSLKTAKEAIDFLLDHSIDSNNVNISFYGGEPLLAFDLIKDVVDYVENVFKGKKISYNMTSNGTLLDEEKINFLIENDFSLMISLDGPKEINDLNRVYPDGSGTYDSIMEKIHLIHEKYPDYAEKLSISMVMDPSNDFDCINSITLDGEDFKPLNLNATIIDTDYDYDNPLNYSEDYIWKFEYNIFLAFMAYWGRYPIEKISSISRSVVQKALNDLYKFEESPEIKTYDVPSGPCIPGQMRLFSDVNGNLFPCERVSESSEAMKIGSLEEGFDLEQIEYLLNFSQLTEEECKNCWAFRYCNQCAKKADDGTKKMSKDLKLSNCIESKASAYEEIMQYLIMTEIPKYYGDQIRNV